MPTSSVNQGRNRQKAEILFDTIKTTMIGSLACFEKYFGKIFFIDCLSPEYTIFRPIWGFLMYSLWENIGFLKIHVPPL